MRQLVRTTVIGLVVALGATACNVILGIADVPAPDDAGPDGGSGADASEGTDAGDSSMPRADAASVGPLDAAPGTDGSTCDPQKTQDDPHNCGTCFHDCLGGQCAGGTCRPFTLFLADGGSGGQPSYLAQDDAYLYWTSTATSGAVWRTDKATGTSSSLLPLDAGATDPRGIAVDDRAVYWGAADGLYRCAKTGCVGSPKQAALGSNVHGVAIDDAGIYWSQNAQILASQKLGNGETGAVLYQGAASTSTTSVATDGQRVYFTDSDGLLHGVGVDGGGSFALGADGGAMTQGIALGGGVVYWTVADPTKGEVLAAPTSTLVPGPALITQQQSPYPVATDGTHLYWANVLGAGSAQIMACALASCAMTNEVLANAVAPNAIVVDATAIYWTDILSGGTAGGVYKVAK